MSMRHRRRGDSAAVIGTAEEGGTRTLPARLVVATNNRGKLREITDLLDAARDRDRSRGGGRSGMGDRRDRRDVRRERARARRCDLAARAGLPALGDDSGLEVAALGGRPGVRSARYAGEGASDAANVAKLLSELRGVPETVRGAAFRCALALAWPGGGLVEIDGRCDGAIAFAPRGSGGFGYDPVFIDRATGFTFAELPDDAKNARSHRGRALRRARRRVWPDQLERSAVRWYDR